LQTQKVNPRDLKEATTNNTSNQNALAAAQFQFVDNRSISSTQRNMRETANTPIVSPMQLAINSAHHAPLQLGAYDKVKSGLGAKSTGIGVTAGAVAMGLGASLLALSPLGLVGLGLATAVTATCGSAYLMGEDGEPEAQGEQTAPLINEGEVSKPKPKKESFDDRWREIQDDKREYETSVDRLNADVDKATSSVEVGMRTNYRKILTRMPLMAELNGRSSRDIHSWRGEIPIKVIRDALGGARAAVRDYESFQSLLSDFHEIPPLEHLTKRNFKKWGHIPTIKKERLTDFTGRQETADKILESLHPLQDMLEQQDKLETEIRLASRHGGVEDPGEEIDIPDADDGPNWFDTTYPNGWVRIAGNAFAAIMPAAVGALPGGALVMFQEALANGSIADRGTGASGVKWAKNELKVRRTRLESIEIAGDTRLSGDIRSVPTETTGLAREIRVLEFTSVINAH